MSGPEELNGDLGAFKGLYQERKRGLQGSWHRGLNVKTNVLVYIKGGSWVAIVGL